VLEGYLIAHATRLQKKHNFRELRDEVDALFHLFIDLRLLALSI